MFSLTALYRQELGTFFSWGLCKQYEQFKVYRNIETINNNRPEIVWLIQLNKNIKNTSFLSHSSSSLGTCWIIYFSSPLIRAHLLNPGLVDHNERIRVFFYCSHFNCLVYLYSSIGNCWWHFQILSLWKTSQLINCITSIRQRLLHYTMFY